jgi:GNAT superfamily N-acetyltransferase
VVGFAVVRFDLTPRTDQLVALFVDAMHRRSGVASALVDEAVRRSRRRRARTLYVSAAPSDSAVPFYLARGFVPTRDPNPELYALEPDDIHMLLAL